VAFLFSGLMTRLANTCSDFLHFSQKTPKTIGVFFDAVIGFSVLV
jgi:hypothetical protein